MGQRCAGICVGFYHFRGIGEGVVALFPQESFTFFHDAVQLAIQGMIQVIIFLGRGCFQILYRVFGNGKGNGNAHGIVAVFHAIHIRHAHQSGAFFFQQFQ